MIRRSLSLPNVEPCWLVISQVEHARLSAALARCCEMSLGVVGDRKLPVGDSRGEMLAAIERHDDGWAEWEAAPTLDPELGRPLSFQEVPTETALQIWTRSIDSASQCGPLAAAMVAGHFARLAEHSDSAPEHPPLQRWPTRIQQQRADSVQTWVDQDPANRTAAAAQRAVDWLQLFDILSLWLCHAWPMSGEAIAAAAGWASAGRELSLATEFVAIPSDANQQRLTAIGGTGETYRARAATRPWRFEPSIVEAGVDALMVPAAYYDRSDEWKAAARPCRLQWHLARQKNVGDRSSEVRPSTGSD